MTANPTETDDIEEQLDDLRSNTTIITTVSIGDDVVAVPPEVETLSEPPEDGVYVRPAITGGAAGERWVVQTVDAATDTVQDELPVQDETDAVREAIGRADHDDLPVLPETVEDRSHR